MPITYFQRGLPPGEKVNPPQHRRCHCHKTRTGTAAPSQGEINTDRRFLWRLEGQRYDSDDKMKCRGVNELYTGIIQHQSLCLMKDGQREVRRNCNCLWYDWNPTTVSWKYLTCLCHKLCCNDVVIIIKDDKLFVQTPLGRFFRRQCCVIWETLAKPSPPGAWIP